MISAMAVLTLLVSLAATAQDQSPPSQDSRMLTARGYSLPRPSSTPHREQPTSSTTTARGRVTPTIEYSVGPVRVWNEGDNWSWWYMQGDRFDLWVGDRGHVLQGQMQGMKRSLDHCKQPETSKEADLRVNTGCSSILWQFEYKEERFKPSHWSAEFYLQYANVRCVCSYVTSIGGNEGQCYEAAKVLFEDWVP